jgi:tetratricopeptide (TPR) repeat protein
MLARANEIGKIATSFAATLLVAGFVMCAIACPSGQLIGAVCIEVLFLAILIFWRHFRPKPRENVKRAEALSWLRSQHPKVFLLRDGAQCVGTITALAVAVVACIEFTAFSLAFFRLYRPAETLYIVVPVSKVLTGHPAQTLEFLAGAYAEARNYRLAYPLYESLARIRKASLAPGDELVFAIWTDIGMLYMREKNYAQSESSFRKSLSMASAARSDLQTGRVLTGLANALREQERFPEAEKTYLQAIDMRAHAFGKDSLRVAESLTEYAELLERMGRHDEARECRGKVIDILASQKEAYSLPTAFIAILTGIVAIISFFIFGGESLVVRMASFLLRSKRKRAPLTDSEEQLLTSLAAPAKQPAEPLPR